MNGEKYVFCKYVFVNFEDNITKDMRTIYRNKKWYAKEEALVHIEFIFM